MPVMTNTQWENLISEDKEVLKALGILNLVKPKTRNKTPKNKALPPLEPYVLKRITTCHICKIVSTTYFKMLATTGKYFLTSVRIEQEDILPLDIIKENKDYCIGCSNCYKVLKEESKEELIGRIIRLSKNRGI